MKYIWTRLAVAVWLAFMIATVGPVIVPGLATVTAPVTCPGGKINVKIDVYNPAPGETDTTFTPLCTSAAGQTTEIPVVLSMLVIGAFALLPCWLLMMVIPAGAFGFLNQNRRYSSRPAQDWSAGSSGDGGRAAERLRELKQAFDGGLITQGEYDQKRREILKGM